MPIARGGRTLYAVVYISSVRSFVRTYNVNTSQSLKRIFVQVSQIDNI